MRYRNWDVLLFPAGSKVPIQEFKTQCFVTKDKDAPFLHAVHLGPRLYHEQGFFNQLPVLTTFIPSLPPDSPFQVSIHSWDTPHASIQIETNMGPEDTVLFEARVYIDGVFSAWVYPASHVDLWTWADLMQWQYLWTANYLAPDHGWVVLCPLQWLSIYWFTCQTLVLVRMLSFPDSLVSNQADGTRSRSRRQPGSPSLPALS